MIIALNFIIDPEETSSRLWSNSDQNYPHAQSQCKKKMRDFFLMRYVTLRSVFIRSLMNLNQSIYFDNFYMQNVFHLRIFPLYKLLFWHPQQLITSITFYYGAVERCAFSRVRSGYSSLNIHRYSFHPGNCI